MERSLTLYLDMRLFLIYRESKLSQKMLKIQILKGRGISDRILDLCVVFFVSPLIPGYIDKPPGDMGNLQSQD